jgi:HEAT repeat protein
VSIPIPKVPNIWQLQSKGDIDGLIAALRHPEPAARKGAAAALRALGAWQAVPALEDALAGENDWQAHAAIMAALQYLDRDIHIETMIKSRDVSGLTMMLNSAKVEDIQTACNALAVIGDRQAVEPLVMTFRNPLLPNRARLAAAEALLKLESAPAVVTLLGALRKENWQVRRNAAAVLGQLQAAWATDALIKALDDPQPLVQRTVVAALRRLRTPEAVTAVAAYESAQQKMATQEMPPEEILSEETTGGGAPVAAASTLGLAPETKALPALPASSVPPSPPSAPPAAPPAAPMPRPEADAQARPLATVGETPPKPVTAPLPPPPESEGRTQPITLPHKPADAPRPAPAASSAAAETPVDPVDPVAGPPTPPTPPAPTAPTAEVKPAGEQPSPPPTPPPPEEVKSEPRSE